MRKVLISALAVLSVAGAAAPVAQAAPRDFYGVMAFRQPKTVDINRMGRGRVGTLRVNVYWGEVQQLGSIYFDWSRYDQIIGDAARRNIRVLPTVYGSPGWAAAKGHYPPDAEHRDEFADFMESLARRYGPNGSFWIANPGIRKKPVVDVQVWNEPSSPNFWRPRPRARAYKKLLVAAHTGLKRGDPAMRVVLAGLFRRPNVRNGVPMKRYLNGLYRAGAKPYFEAIAVHPYARRPRGVIRTVRVARRIARSHRDGKAKVWITEVGWASSGRPSPYTVKPKRQARYLRQLYRSTARNRKRLRIESVVWFCFKDLRQRLWIYRTGLLTAGGKAKPAWKSFVRLTGGRP